MTGFLTTHVLDTARGCPAGGLRIDLYRIGPAGREHLRTMTTNTDGRTDAPILPADEFQTGEYILVFHAGAYHDTGSANLPSSRFLDKVPIRFTMSQDDHYHVPLLLSPYGYSTYRGS